MNEQVIFEFSVITEFRANINEINFSNSTCFKYFQLK